uniref:Uncharacterized protein n=1 Tax=Vibrio sp. FF_291 TaxID=1652832 RepID=A0A0H3ZT22_9VIBR|nr:hypothetical protein [Vibrio sp. FF_291]
MPDYYERAYNKAINRLELTENERENSALVDSYLAVFGVPSYLEGKPWLNAYQRQILLAFCDFIDDPLRCHKGVFKNLHYCKSIQKGLQHKQRVTLVKFLTALFTFTNIETGFVGTYGDNETPAIYENDWKLLQGIQHYKIRTRFNMLWNEKISKTRYYDCVRMFKACNFLEVEACYLSNADANAIRQELREVGASLEEINDIPRVYSHASFKYITQSFFDLFKFVTQSDYMLKFKEKAIAKRLERKLSLSYAAFDTFGATFKTRKNKFLAKEHWPKCATTAPPEPQFKPFYH